MHDNNLRIGIDGRCLEGKLTGIGRYVYELCRVIDQQITGAEFFVYSRTSLNVPLFSGRWHSRVEPIKYFRRLKGNLWLKLRCGVLAQRDNLDFFWGNATLLPRLGRGIRSISTVHDLNYQIVPETMGTANLWAFKLFFRRDVLKADVVLSNSCGTARRLKEFLGRNSNEIIYPAINSSFSIPNSSLIHATLQKHCIQGPYHLSVATWEPRKNLELLIHAYIDLKLAGQLPDHQLVLAGGKGWKDDKLRTLLNNAPPNTIIPLGYVDDADLPSLYAGATAFVFPSIYEGFGIPLLEARACGTNVIASDIPELRESGGDAIFIQPTKEGIQKGLILSLTATRREPGILPSWDAEGRKLVEVFYS